MEQKVKVQEIVIDGTTYIPKGDSMNQAPTVDGLPFVLIRGYGSGVQYGYMKSRTGCEVVLLNSRRIWSWNKATETSQIACEGVGTDSKVTMIIPEKVITDVIEVLTITEQGAKNLINQPVWKK